ncbi:peptide-methionine (S)-S-oxide reductase MsrA [Mycoplasmopsis edwardii]|uniref:Peptide-methionine (S)-S-oxide reductase MsrA n=1 Tax=Mycoplasmopsis edwardii TaxID=53558 RepID=A0ACD4PHG8_9BACT|nr:peptide-methionine (S)-S-oxide reductase MsrA [Mycoplasmopsis edwardii]WBP84042.1 peptide-methionine (S)-S-oxide reductase MsrA [Mycoplasmopsis edwardii]
MKKEVFIAGGCFWGVEAYFSRLKGVEDASSYYINGGFEGVSYQEVCQASSHAEAVKVVYDDMLISEETIWNLYLNIVDPYSLNKQGNDKGVQYRVGIYSNDQELLNKYKALNEEFIKNEGKENYLEFLPVSDQTRAEEYHQKYLDKNPNGYCHINLYSIPEKYLKEDKK